MKRACFVIEFTQKSSVKTSSLSFFLFFTHELFLTTSISFPTTGENTKMQKKKKTHKGNTNTFFNKTEKVNNRLPRKKSKKTGIFFSLKFLF